MHEPDSPPAPSPRVRIGLFGGSFDPVHLGHLKVARTAQAAFELARVVFVPARRPPHKPDRELAPDPHRLAMLELALADEPTWTASDVELRRSGPSYTIDTVRALPALVGQPDARVHLVLGSDNLAGLPDWREARALLELVVPIVVLRDESDLARLDEVRRALAPEAWARVRRGLLLVPPIRGRSTDLRARIAAGEDVRGELPPGVWEYLLREGIYGAR